MRLHRTLSVRFPRAPRSAARWLLALSASLTLLIPARVGSAGSTGNEAIRATHASADSIPARDRVQAEELARLLSGPAANRPLLLHVGFQVLYRSGHITGSRYIGPGSKPEGLVALRLALKRLPRHAPIVLYCGCCPWQDCPNVQPAARTARELGFDHVRVLFVAKNLQTDWIDKGFPMSEGTH